MATFEEQLNNLLKRTHSIKSPINAAAIGTDINEYNRRVKYGSMMWRFFTIIILKNIH